MAEAETFQKREHFGFADNFTLSHAVKFVFFVWLAPFHSTKNTAYDRILSFVAYKSPNKVQCYCRHKHKWQ